MRRREAEVSLSRKHRKNSAYWTANRETAFMVSPGLLLLLLGLGILVAPRFFLALLAIFFVAIGALACFVGWKFVQLKRKFMKMARDLEAKVYVQGVQVARPADDSDSAGNPESKKIILH